MNHILTYQVYPTIPEPLAFLETLARNLWWCWKPDAIELFRRIDPRLWEDAGQNPIVLLSNVPQNRLEELSKDDSFLDHQQQVRERFQKRVAYTLHWSKTPYGSREAIAYFSMEFGLHESLRLFAGGLGVLAGDHLKAASNMALPLVGVGLMYRHGYFRQFLDADGWQQEKYPETELYNLPVERARDQQGKEINVSIMGPEGLIHAVVWRITVGRIPLFLLDTNLPENPAKAREITSRLYTAEPGIRLAQEMLLGIGGMRALDAMGIFPAVCHMNEGHSAFLTIERLSLIMSKYGLDLKSALELIPRITVFTTHTPVAAGHDVFPVDLVRPILKPFEPALGIPVDDILSWGITGNGISENMFSMFILGLRMAQFINGVSALHGKVARKMWSHLWPELPEDDVPISHVTNGIHVSTWISPEISKLFERHLGPEWYMSSRKPENISRIDGIYDEELWRAHEMSRTQLIRYCRKRMIRQYIQRNAPSSAVKDVESVLDQDVLTIAFARRFAAYKRASLLIRDPGRLAAMINSEARPVQFIFAGKAHPKDQLGKELIKQIIQFVRDPRFRNRFIFIEDYDFTLARYLVQGADVWLNTPRRPNEACGTSGMKAAANGVLNVSILDGWWCEGYDESRGWKIGDGEEFDDMDYQDTVESQALYNVLENQVIPCFYEQKTGEMPARWVKMMKASMKMAMQDYCSLRMVGEYEERFYRPIAERLNHLVKNDARELKDLTSQHERLRKFWKDIRISPPVQEHRGPFRVGESFPVNVEIHLGGLSPDELDVELYSGVMRSVDSLNDIRITPMAVSEIRGNGDYQYRCTVPCRRSGRYGYTIRITPKKDDFLKFRPGLTSWS